MENVKSDSGCYWVDKAITCNGCKFLNFHRCGCRRNLPPGQVRTLSSYKNGDGYIAVLKPPDCDYVRERKKAGEVPEEARAS